MKLSVPKGNIGGSSMLDDSDSTATHLVDIISLDCLVEIDFSNIGLIKVDVEGMELEVLLGAISIIRSSLPIILFEQFSSSIINGYSKVQLLLIQEGYCFFVLKESHFSESKWLRRIKRIGLFIMNGTLKYDLIKISNLESKYYPLIVAIHESYL